VANLERYRHSPYERLLVCAQNQSQERVLRWIGKVEKEGSIVGDFADPGKKFETLDRTLCVALVATVKGEMARSLELLKTWMLNEKGHTLRGRQVLFEIYRHLATLLDLVREISGMSEVIKGVGASDGVI